MTAKRLAQECRGRESSPVCILFSGDPGRSIGPIPIQVNQYVTMDSTGELRLVFDENTWNYLISFEPGTPVALGGTLELNFARDVNVASQIGRSIRIFDWTGVTPEGQFDIASPYSWDVTRLYTTGEITLIPEPTTMSIIVVGCTLYLASCRYALQHQKPDALPFESDPKICKTPDN